jgi:hypothetical protein
LQHVSCACFRECLLLLVYKGVRCWCHTCLLHMIHVIPAAAAAAVLLLLLQAPVFECAHTSGTSTSAAESARMMLICNVERSGDVEQTAVASWQGPGRKHSMRGFPCDTPVQQNNYPSFM